MKRTIVLLICFSVQLVFSPTRTFADTVVCTLPKTRCPVNARGDWTICKDLCLEDNKTADGTLELECYGPCEQKCKDLCPPLVPMDPMDPKGIKNPQHTAGDISESQVAESSYQCWPEFGAIDDKPDLQEDSALGLTETSTFVDAE